MTSNVEAIRRLFKVDRSSVGNQPALPSIFPGQDAPVVRLSGGDRELVTMSWGFVLPQSGKAPKRVTNSRDDKATASPFWKSSFQERRCLVPVTSFAEPKGKKPAVWHWFGLKGAEARPLFSFAGLWRSWRGELRGELVELDVFAFLTTKPNDVVKPIHPNRMPVILRPEDHETWLLGTPEEAIRLAVPYPSEEMHVVHKGETRDDGR